MSGGSSPGIRNSLQGVWKKKTLYFSFVVVAFGLIDVESRSLVSHVLALYCISMIIAIICLVTDHCRLRKSGN